MDTPDDEGAGAVHERLVEGTAGQAILMLSPAGTIETWPEPARALYGHDSAVAVGERLEFLSAPGSEVGTETLLDAADGGAAEEEGWHETADGSVFWATMSVSALAEGGYAVTCRDTTDKRQYEKMLERQNDRLKEFTDILAHDLRNPLNTIDQRLTLYRETGDESHIDSIGETADRMERLVEDLLRVARQGDVVTDAEPVDVVDTVETAWEGTGRATAATLDVETLPAVNADADRLCQLFENLFRNAVEHGSTSSQSPTDDAVEHGSSSQSPTDDAVEHGSTSSRSSTDDAVEHGSSSQSPTDDAVEHGSSSQSPTDDAVEGVTVRVGAFDGGLYVEDDGPGVPDDVDDVFAHGVTTDPEGSGYGLSVVRTIAHAHGWDVVATDGADGGARFELTGVEFIT